LVYGRDGVRRSLNHGFVQMRVGPLDGRRLGELTGRDLESAPGVRVVRDPSSALRELDAITMN
jgi:hypothetical protein